MDPLFFDAELLGAVKTIVKRLGLEYIDNTPAKGPLWVVCGVEWSTMLMPLGMQYFPNGGNATGKRAAWAGNVR